MQGYPANGRLAINAQTPYMSGKRAAAYPFISEQHQELDMPRHMAQIPELMAKTRAYQKERDHSIPRMRPPELNNPAMAQDITPFPKGIQHMNHSANPLLRRSNRPNPEMLNFEQPSSMQAKEPV
mmetsp:Transcript_8382/g.12766  ORF Transcript_8382/g.12766 Transcript_8382/m.12766 type:complete len:125 (+) Transcript_8382:221-595(+)